jgi:hypothetical protein
MERVVPGVLCCFGEADFGLDPCRERDFGLGDGGGECGDQSRWSVTEKRGEKVFVAAYILFPSAGKSG